MKSQDLFYDLPSSFKSKNTFFANKTEKREPEIYLKNQPGFCAPSPQKYEVKRLFDSNKRSKNTCTFGIPFDKYRNVVVGITRPAGGNHVMFSERFDNNKPGYSHELGSTLA